MLKRIKNPLFWSFLDHVHRVNRLSGDIYRHKSFKIPKTQNCYVLMQPLLLTKYLRPCNDYLMYLPAFNIIDLNPWRWSRFSWFMSTYFL